VLVGGAVVVPVELDRERDEQLEEAVIFFNS